MIIRKLIRARTIIYLISFIIIFNFLFLKKEPSYTQNIFNLIKSDMSWIDGDQDTTVYAIPRLIHFVYLKGEKGMILEAYRPFIQRCIQTNPQMKFVLWTKENMNLFLKKMVTKKNRIHMNESQRKLIHRADIFRYILLYHFGGIYMDLDTVCIKPIYSYVKNHSFVLAIEPPIHTRIYLGIEKVIANNFFASKPRHEFMKYLLNNLKQNASVDDDILTTTGPLYVDQQFTEFINKTTSSSMKIHILNTTQYFPQLNIQFLREICKIEPVPEACSELESYAIWLKTSGLKKAVIAHAGLGHAWKETKGPNFNAYKYFPTLKHWP